MFIIPIILVFLYRGKDFRKCFASVGDVIALAKVPIMSLTASAPPRVETELVKALHLSDPVYIKESLNRPNIFYSVAKKSSLEVSEECRHVKSCSSIVYNNKL